MENPKPEEVEAAAVESYNFLIDLKARLAAQLVIAFDDEEREEILQRMEHVSHKCEFETRELKKSRNRQ